MRRNTKSSGGILYPIAIPDTVNPYRCLTPTLARTPHTTVPMILIQPAARTPTNVLTNYSTQTPSAGRQHARDRHMRAPERAYSA